MTTTYDPMSNTGFYEKIYIELCESRKSRKSMYGVNSGLHRHHIIPRHSGGDNSPENLTFLTQREHKIAHFLLWKIHKNPNDLRAITMLGFPLNLEQMRIVGNYCRDNKIGIFSEKYDREDRRKWTLLGNYSQVKNKIGIHSDEKKRIMTDGSRVFSSIKEASEFHRVHERTIRRRLKSERYPLWVGI